MARRFFPIFALFLAVICLGCAGQGPGPASGQPSGPTRIALFVTSDIHENLTGTEQELDGRKQVLGGIPRIAATYASESKKYDGALLLSAGDDLTGIFYQQNRGRPEMRAMTMAGYTAACPGNHEFDYGLALYGEALSHAGFDVLCANLSAPDTAFSRKVKPWAVYEVAGVRIGVFGLMTPELFRLVRPIPGLSLDRDYREAARKCVAELRGQGCRVVVALSHMGIGLDSKLAQDVPGIDFIVGGHDHLSADRVVAGTRIVHDGSGGIRLGVLAFGFAGGQVSESSFDTLLLDGSRMEDPELAAYLSPWLEAFRSSQDKPIGSFAHDLDISREALRGGESAAGDMVADSWLAWFPHAHAALVNSGAIRGDRVIPAGAVTYLTMEQMLPFGNEIMLARLKGRDLLRVLEISASALAGPGDQPSADPARTPSGGFLQVAGLRLALDLSRRPYRAGDKGQVLFPGERLVSAKIRQKGSYADIDPEETYTVLVSDYLAGGGDGYAIFKEPGVEVEPGALKTASLLADYIRKNSPLAPAADGRIALKP